MKHKFVSIKAWMGYWKDGGFKTELGCFKCRNCGAEEIAPYNAPPTGTCDT